MISFLIYEGKVAIALAVFYMFYRLMLRKETFHRLNRVVLVGTVVLAFVLPLCIITIHRRFFFKISNKNKINSCFRNKRLSSSHFSIITS